MSGDATDGLAAYEELHCRSVSLVFLKEPHTDTDTYKKSLPIKQILHAFEQSEKEVEDLQQYTKEGVEWSSPPRKICQL